jgi:hypothetical protein
VDRRPYIVGPTADKVLGFLTGFFGLIPGWIVAVAVTFLWAGSDPGPDVAERRRHASSVSMWSGLGFLVAIVLAVVLILAVFSRPRP